MMLMLGVAMSLAAAQTPPDNRACALLTTSQVTSLIGAAKALPVTSAPTGWTCMWQAGNKVVTVLIATAPSPEGAARVFESKKRMVSGEAVPGWTLPAYAGVQRPTAVAVGFLKGQTLTEVKVLDALQKAEELSAKLKAVMKEVAARK
jgi:hypothetical protein